MPGGEPLSPVESGGKPLGGNRTVDSPPSPGAWAEVVGGRLHSLAAQVAEGCLNFRFQRKQPSANSPHAAPDWLRCSRQGGCVLLVDWVDGAWLFGTQR